MKTVRFRDKVYVGDPINAVKIFNDKEVDELIFLDISEDRHPRGPDYELIAHIASECFMPLAYGGGIRTVEQIRELFSLGVEKVCLNTIAIEQPEFLKKAAMIFGSQSVVASIDVKRSLFGKYQVWADGGKRKTGLDAIDFAQLLEANGAGEIMLTAIDLDGTMQGYDIQIIQAVSKAVRVPVVACGGAGSLAHMAAAIQQGQASAVAAGSMFVFHGRHRAVLINYPSPEEIQGLLG